MTLEHRREQIRERYAHFFSPEDEARHPLYAALCAQANHDNTLVDLLLDTPESQARPNLVLAALHDLALEDPDGELAVHYPSAAHYAACSQNPDTAARPPANAPPPNPDAASTVTRWAHDHRSLVLERMSGRSTQTNEIGRNAVLSAGLAEASQGTPVALIDVGCSAGLNLLVDRYRIDRSDGRVLGDTESEITIRTEISGRPMPTTTAQIAWRRGIDLDPPDLDDETSVRWLLACQWPDDLARFERSRRAMGLWRSVRPRPAVVTGDALSTLEQVIHEVPDDLLIVVQHSWVATYMSIEDQQALAALLRHEMQRRPLAWLSFEHPRLVPGLSHPAGSVERIPGATTLFLEGSGLEPRVLAQAHPHGSWVRWEA